MNSLLTIDMITREAVRLFRNSNAFIQNINRQYDDQYARDGAKIGTTLRIRLPNDYTVRTGTALQVQSTTEQQITMTLATQKGVDVSFSTAERTMSLDDYSERVLSPMINNLAGDIANDIMSGSETGICNFVSNVDGSNNIIAPTATQFLEAGAYLNDNSGPMGDRKVINDPWTDARVVGSLTGLFNPQPQISEQYKTGSMRGQALGFSNWMMDQTVIKHQAGTFTAGTVAGANQTGTTLLLNAITGTLNAGDIITIEGVYAVNRVTKETTGKLRQFAVQSDVAALGTSVTLYPAIIPAIAGVKQQYQTVTASPANLAALSLTTKASEIYRHNIAYAPDAVTMATADLELPRGVHEAARESFDGVSMRMITDYLVGTDQMITRLDILYGFLYVRPEWGCVVADKI